MNEDDPFKIWQFYARSVKPMRPQMPQMPQMEKKVKAETLKSANQNPTSHNKIPQVTPPESHTHKPALYLGAVTPQEIEKPKKYHAEKNTKRRMRKGKFPIEARIDLHGYGQDKAFDALVNFIKHAYLVQKRHLLIITGRGAYCYQKLASSGVLIRKVPQWLKEPPFAQYISVIEQASIFDGAEGALYVILRKN